MNLEWIKKQTDAYHLLTNLPIRIYDVNETVLYEKSASPSIFEREFPSECFHSRIFFDMQRTASNENYISHYVNNMHGEFYIIVGPFIYASSSKDDANALNYHYDYLSYLFDIKTKSELQTFSNPLAHQFFDRIKVEYREIDFFHHNYFVEKMFFHHLFSNRLSEEDQELFVHQEPGLMTENYVSNMKQLGSVILTLAGRYSIEFGLDSHIAFTISDSYFRRLDKSKDLRQVNVLLQKALDEYVNALDIVDSNKYSKKIHDAKKYIDHNLSLKLTLSDISEQVKLNPSYLSREFKKEVGLNISDYILSEKIKEAKIMLDFSNYSLREISDILNFSSKSYFIRCFKKIEDVTPMDYKNKKKPYPS